MLLNSSKPLFLARPVVFRRVPAVLGASRFDAAVFRHVVNLGAARTLRIVSVVLRVVPAFDRFAPTFVRFQDGTYSTR